MNSLHIVYSVNKKTILGTVPKIGMIKVDGYKKPLTAKDIEEIQEGLSEYTGYADICILNYFELGEDLSND